MTVFPRAWTITVEGRAVTVVAGTREAAEKVAAARLAKAVQRGARGRYSPKLASS